MPMIVGIFRVCCILSYQKEILASNISSVPVSSVGVKGVMT